MAIDTAIITGMIGIIVYLIYIAKDFMSKPITREQDHAQTMKWLNVQNLGVFIYLLTSWFVLVLVYILYKFSATLTIEPLMEKIYMIFIIIVPSINVLYLIFFVIFKIQSSLKKGAQIRR